MSTAKIFVGYRTRLVQGVEKLTPEFTPPGNYKTPEAIAKWQTEKAEDFKVAAANQPYTGTFDAVVVCDPASERIKEWNFKGREPGNTDGKKAVSLAVRDWILNTYGEAWPNETHPAHNGPPKAVFIGFEPKVFLKMIGIECSLPPISKPLPPPMWYSNSDHRDITEAVMPSGFKNLDWSIVLKTRRPLDEDDAEKYDAVIKDWPGPGINPKQDVHIAVMLATQLGFV